MNTPNLEEIKNRISPQKFNQILKTVDLTSLYLSSIAASLNKREWVGPATLNLSEDSNVISKSESRFAIEMNYSLKAVADKETVLEISVRYVTEFKVDSTADDDFIEIFKKYSLPLHTYPFFREMVNSIVVRMDLPSLILPLKKPLVSEKVTA